MKIYVHLKNGESRIVWNIAWGYDIGDDYAHITTNISPTVEGASIDVFYSYEIVRIINTDNDDTIYEL